LIADALSNVLASGGGDRLGVCVADPCRCGYVDRTRAGRPATILLPTLQ